jgi:outer membrane lipoprotein-sorting protein
MQKLRYILMALAAGISSICSAQNDPKAEAILKKVAKVYQSYSTINSTFAITTTPVNGKPTTENGTIWLKGKKFKLNYANQEIYCDGLFTWTFNQDDLEVIKENFKLRDNAITPNEIFTIYNRDFKSKFEGPTVRNGKSYDVIMLSPKKKVNFAYVKLEVDKASNKIQRVVQHFKNGTQVAIEIKSLTPNTSMADNFFTWNQAAHSDAVLVDLTKKK